MKILISWMAFTHDFIKNRESFTINPTGTHSDFYKHHIKEYNKHILLSSGTEILTDNPTEREQEQWRKFRMLNRYLKDQLADNNIEMDIQPEYMNVDVINIQAIKSQLSYTTNLLIEKYSNSDIDVFVSPGTPSMQTTWYLLAMEYNLNLFQIRPPHAREGIEAASIREFISVQTGSAARATSILLRTESNIQGPYENEKIKSCFELADKVAATYDTSALVLGETGTGKELIAQRIYQNSLRSKGKGRFVTLNCAGFADNLLESRLFGYAKNAFTGAVKDTNGVFQDAHGGTIFLDEIGDITPKMQQTLLRVLQEKEVSKLGATKTEKIDVHVIAGTHKNIWEQIEKGTFRADLYYRLAVAEITTYSIREFSIKERTVLFEYFNSKISREECEYLDSVRDHEKKHLAKGVLDLLLAHPFPGNIREVENLFRRFYAFVEGNEITAEDIPHRIRFPEGTMHSLKLKDVEKRHILKVLKMVDGNKSKAAEIMGISRGKLDNNI